MRIVILGANGQVGRHVYQQVCTSFPAEDVLGCVRQKHLHFEGCTGDKKQRSFVFDPFTDNWEKLGKVDVLINCIGVIRESGELTFTRAHIGLTRLILQHRVMMGLPKVIQVSVLGADKESSSAFMRTKAIADDELLQHENTYVVRPSIVCSHNTMMVQKLKRIGKISKWLLNRLPFPRHFLSVRIQPVLAEDLSQIIVKIARDDAGQRMVNITGPEEISFDGLIRLLNNGRIKIIPFSKQIFGMVFPVISFLMPNLLSREQMMLLSQNNVADNRACSSLLGREMSSTWSFWQKELAISSNEL